MRRRCMAWGHRHCMRRPAPGQGRRKGGRRATAKIRETVPLMQTTEADPERIPGANDGGGASPRLPAARTRGDGVKALWVLFAIAILRVDMPGMTSGASPARARRRCAAADRRRRGNRPRARPRIRPVQRATRRAGKARAARYARHRISVAAGIARSALPGARAVARRACAVRSRTDPRAGEPAAFARRQRAGGACRTAGRRRQARAPRSSAIRHRCGARSHATWTG